MNELATTPAQAAPQTTMQRSASVETAVAREAQEVQAAMIAAKRDPRDETYALTRILEACRRPSLAERAVYAYPRGGTTVSGPSIRLAECIAKAWGNLTCGVKELERRKGESTIQAYCWDLETNFRQEKTFTVKHARDTKGGLKPVTDERDIYEVVANQGSRRLRACILGVIPADVVEAAVAECERTMAGKTNEPIKDRIARMVDAFHTQFGVPQEAIERRLGHKLEATIEAELVSLKKIYASLRDGAASREDFFELPQAEQKPEDLQPGKHKLAAIGAAKTEPADATVDAQAIDNLTDPDQLADDLTASIVQSENAKALQDVGKKITAHKNVLGAQYTRVEEAFRARYVEVGGKKGK